MDLVTQIAKNAGLSPGGTAVLRLQLARHTTVRQSARPAPLRETLEGRAIVKSWECRDRAAAAVDPETRETWLAAASEFRKAANARNGDWQASISTVTAQYAAADRAVNYTRMAKQVTDPAMRENYRQLAEQAWREAGVA